MYDQITYDLGSSTPGDGVLLGQLSRGIITVVSKNDNLTELWQG